MTLLDLAEKSPQEQMWPSLQSGAARLGQIHVGLERRKVVPRKARTVGRVEAGPLRIDASNGVDASGQICGASSFFVFLPLFFAGAVQRNQLVW